MQIRFSCQLFFFVLVVVITGKELLAYFWSLEVSKFFFWLLLEWFKHETFHVKIDHALPTPPKSFNFAITPWRWWNELCKHYATLDSREFIDRKTFDHCVYFFSYISTQVVTRTSIISCQNLCQILNFQLLLAIYRVVNFWQIWDQVWY